jgi:hypothetical protein
MPGTKQSVLDRISIKHEDEQEIKRRVQESLEKAPVKLQTKQPISEPD